MYSTKLISLESSESLHSIFCVYILGQRPVRLFILKELKQFNLFYAAQYITILIVISLPASYALGQYWAPDTLYLEASGYLSAKTAQIRTQIRLQISDTYLSNSRLGIWVPRYISRGYIQSQIGSCVLID
jgi:hypothetical protein